MARWGKIDARLHNHPKMLMLEAMGERACEGACTLWLNAFTYVQQQQSDGFVATLMLPKLSIFGRHLEHAKALASVGLWDEVEGGYAFHDYLDHNDSADHIQATTTKKSHSQKEYRDRKKAEEKSKARSENVDEHVDGLHPGLQNLYTKNVDEHVESTDKTRQDKKRQDKTRQDAYASRARVHEEPKTEVANDIEPEAIAFDLYAVAGLFSDERQLAGGMPYGYQKSNYDGLSEAVTIFRECAKKLGITPVEATRRSARNYCASKFAQDNQFTIGPWLRDPARNLTEAPPPPPPPRKLTWAERNVG